jgi:hypothetical protein
MPYTAAVGKPCTDLSFGKSLDVGKEMVAVSVAEGRPIGGSEHAASLLEQEQAIFLRCNKSDL